MNRPRHGTHQEAETSAAAVLWITGRPAAGKSTLARLLAEELASRGLRATLLDSDEVREAITPNPRYSPEERELFYRALAYLAARLAQEGIVAIVAATSHRAEYRRWARSLCPQCFMVYARCPAQICEARDPKDLYRQARSLQGTTLPGVGVAYQEPIDADYILDTDAPLASAQIKAIVDTFLGGFRPRALATTANR